jgi:hypothetical protein
MDVVRTESKVDWAAIMAGAVLATAIGLILLAFGATLGLSVTSPYEGEGISPTLYVIAAGIWMLWVQLVSFSVAGYVTARLRSVQPGVTEHENDVRDGLHGVLAWGAAVIAAAVISFAGIGGVTAAAQADAPGGIVASVTEAASAEIDQAAAEERAANPAASDETANERRAEIARKLTILAGFVAAASLLAGAAAAVIAAGFGGKHRDQNTRLPFFVLRREQTTAPAPPPV